MSLTEFLFHSENFYYSAALVLMLFISILEGVLVLLGAGLSDMIDSLIPDFDIDADVSISDNSFSLSKFFSWIKVKEVPILMLFIIFLSSFGLIGLIIQYILLNLSVTLWTSGLAFIPSFILGIYSLNIFGSFVSKILPKDETSSISRNDLIGHVAVITIGKARKDFPAEAKTRDKHGQTHYFMIEPEETQIEFTQGDRVLILKKLRNGFIGTIDLPDKLN